MNPIFRNKIPSQSEELLMASVELQTAREKIQEARDCMIGHHDDLRDCLLSLVVQLHRVQDQIDADYQISRYEENGSK